MYFTRNYTAGSSAQMSEEGFAKLKICKIELDEKDNFINEVIELPFNNKEYNYAHPAISYDDRVLYFSSDMPGGLGGMDIWMVKIESGKWSTPTNLGPDINTAGNEVFPYIEDNGKLYFSSDGLGGLGGLDLFEAVGMGSTWNVKNMGAPFNSSGDDFGIAFDDYTNGYFSSNRGGLDQNDDIYHFEQVKIKKQTFTIELLDVKTSDKLTGKVKILDRQTGNITSIDVKNGWVEVELDPARTMKFDATVDGYNPDSLVAFTDAKSPKFEIRLKKSMELFLDALVLNNPKDKKPVANATVTLLADNGQARTFTTGDDGRIQRQEIEAENKYSLTASSNNKISDKASVNTMFQSESKTYDQTLYIDNNGAVCLAGVIIDKNLKGIPSEGTTVTIADVATGVKLYETITPTNGTFKSCEVEVGKKYRISVVKPGYFSKSEEVTITADQKTDVELKIEIDKIVVGRPIKIDNIYFDVNQSNIRPDAAKELDKIVALMKENPELVIELSSHTDCRNPANANLILSDKRAKSSVQYIIEHGIDAKRIIGKGYGETQLVNKCECEGSRNVTCTDKEHQENRRTEFKVIGFLRNGVIYNANGTAIQPQ
jgi:outer membrane protein OmpA-like peptidoglycan-associated protein